MTFHSRRYESAVAAQDVALLTLFNAYFATELADCPDRVRTAHRIRHQVYSLENPFEAGNPDGIETDRFDSHSAQSLLIYRPNGMALGTARLILPCREDIEHSFPVQSVLDGDALREFRELPLSSTAEVSRFSISRQLRQLIGTCDEKQNQVIANAAPLMRLGLIQGLVRMSVQHGITHWCAVMEQSLMRMLSAMAIRFHPIGPLVEHHGLRQPCWIALDEMLNAVRRDRPAFWAVLTNGGTAGREQVPIQADCEPRLFPIPAHNPSTAEGMQRS